MLSGKCFVMFYIFSFPPGVYDGTSNLIASILGPSILTLNCAADLNQPVWLKRLTFACTHACQSLSANVPMFDFVYVKL